MDMHQDLGPTQAGAINNAISEVGGGHSELSGQAIT